MKNYLPARSFGSVILPSALFTFALLFPSVYLAKEKIFVFLIYFGPFLVYFLLESLFSEQKTIRILATAALNLIPLGILHLFLLWTAGAAALAGLISISYLSCLSERKPWLRILNKLLWCFFGLVAILWIWYFSMWQGISK